MSDASLTGRLALAAIRRGPWLAALIATAAALPGLAFPFLSDDWHLVASVGEGAPPAAPYRYFRPLYMATFWVDLHLWGATPAMFHLTNLLLIAACAALVVVVVAHYTQDDRLAALAGALFALHPYHVENAAWIAVRGDPLFTALILCAALAYDRWRDPPAVARSARTSIFSPAPRPDHARSSASTTVGLERREGASSAGSRILTSPTQRPLWASGLAPFAALGLLALALLAKESAAVLPAALVAIGYIDRERRPGRSEWLRGLIPMMALAIVHLLVVRPLALGGAGRTLTPGIGVGWVEHAVGFCVGAIVPIDTELIAARPLLAGAAAIGVLALLAAMASLRRRGPLGTSAAGAAIFCVLLLPSIVGFEERYLFLPAVAVGIVLGSLFLAIGGRPALWLGGALVVGWGVGVCMLWSHWWDAARASRALIGGLVQASGDPAVHEIAVANMPFRVHGGSVAGDFQAAIGIAGGRPVPVSAVSYLSYGSSRDDFLARHRDEAVRAGSGSAFVELSIPDRPFCRYVAPGSPGEESIRSPAGRVFFEGARNLRVRVDALPDGRRAAYAWVEGRLERLF